MNTNQLVLFMLSIWILAMVAGNDEKLLDYANGAAIVELLSN